MLSEISQKKTNTIFYHLLVASKKKPKLVNMTQKKQNRHRYREQASGYQWSKEKGQNRGKGLRGTIIMYKIN